MPKGVYERTPDMMTGRYERVPDPEGEKWKEEAVKLYNDPGWQRKREEETLRRRREACRVANEVKSRMAANSEAHRRREKAAELWNDPEYQKGLEETKHKNYCEAANRRGADPEISKKLSEASKKNWRNSDYCRSVRESMEKVQEDPDYRKRLSEGQRRFRERESPGHKMATAEAVSRGLKRRWAEMSPEEQNAQMRPLHEATISKGSPNKCEQLLWEFLEEHYPGLFIPHWIKRTGISGRLPDFVSSDGHKLLVELFGPYYHNTAYFPNRPTEEELVIFYKNLGWDCIVVWAEWPDDVIFEWPNLVKRIDSILRKVS